MKSFAPPETALILVEGIDDIIFVQSVVQRWFGLSFDYYEHKSEKFDGSKIHNAAKDKHIFGVGGKNNIGLLGPILKQFFDVRCNKNPSMPFLLIFDADFPSKIDSSNPERGGFSARQPHLLEQVQKVDSTFTKKQIYLFPEDHDDGDLEILLERIVAKPEITRTWDDYEARITPFSRTLEGNERDILSKKSKIFSYAEALTGFESAGGRERKYLEKNHWNLDPKNKHLRNLHDFLKPHFDSTPISPTP
jgi:hypothetical protein